MQPHKDVVFTNKQARLNESGHVHVKALKFGERYRFEPQFPVVLTVTGKSISSCERSITVKKDSDMDSAIMEGASFLQEEMLKTKIFPIIAFYRANRQWIAARSDSIQVATEKTSRQDGYQQWWDAATNVTALQHWVISKCLERYRYSSEKPANSFMRSTTTNWHLSIQR